MNKQKKRTFGGNSMIDEMMGNVINTIGSLIKRHHCPKVVVNGKIVLKECSENWTKIRV